jgi:7,8-dihydropterin-6-yl-methyl-4-(beta-D-ribofuranosyl)aminobenzene 5'-phosphate synthase
MGIITFSRSKRQRKEDMLPLCQGQEAKETVMNETDDRIIEVDKVTVWVITDNYYDALRPDTDIATRYRVVPGKSIHAEHGLAYYIETFMNGQISACMFDYGLDPAGVLNNLELLELDLRKVKAFGLSHGHFDHWMSALTVLKANKDRIDRGAPFYVGEEVFVRRYSVPPGNADMLDLGQLQKADIEGLGLRVMEVREPVEIIPGGYLTGNIERITEYEKVPPNLLIRRGDKPEQDDFHGEQALFFHVLGRGLVVVSGCAHTGIVNTVRHAQRVSGIEKIHAVLGGFHLTNAEPEVIRRTVADIKALKPDYVIPTHCTGFEAVVAFGREMPDEFNLNTAGTKYTFSR